MDYPNLEKQEQRGDYIENWYQLEKSAERIGGVILLFAAALVVVTRLRAHVRGAPHRACRDRTGAGDLRHHPSRTPQARRPRHDLGQAREARVRVKLPKGRRVRTRRKAIMHLSGCDRIRNRGSTKEEHD